MLLASPVFVQHFLRGDFLRECGFQRGGGENPERFLRRGRREFYQDFNASFATYWKEKTGDSVTVNQSHGGSSKQVTSVVNGLEADVVTMNQPLDIDLLRTGGDLIPANWAARLPNKSVPYTSTILFVVPQRQPEEHQKLG